MNALVQPQQPHLPLPREDCGGTCSCGVEPLAHPKYSFGMLLEARHLALEHRYAATRMNTHDIRLHDFGTVCGLRVIEHPSPECRNEYAILQTGIALDCCGREIVVPEPVFVPLFDGARNGWCGAPESIQQSPPQNAQARTALYIYIAYQQCETDPVPSYVRSCGCCNGSCEHGTCVPSVTREGYQILVTAVPPPVFRNPVGAAFCAWLQAQLKGPGVSPEGHLIYDKPLDLALCDIITQPCPDFCANDNEWLLLASLTFNTDDVLDTIDNCTNRRLVISTGAIVEALECLAATEIDCCKTKDPYLALTGTVSPATVNVEDIGDNTLTYTITATDADASKDITAAFSIDLTIPPTLTFESGTLTIGTGTPSNVTASGSDVRAPVNALSAGETVTLVLKATFDPAQIHAGDSISATASVSSYTGPHAADVSIATTFVDIKLDGPRVIFNELPTTLAAPAFGSWVRNGIEIPFSEAIDPNSASLDPNIGDIFVELLADGSVASVLPMVMNWSNSNALLRLAYNLGVTPADPIDLLVQQIEQNPQTQYGVRLRLLGGPKGATAADGASIKGADGMRLDGDPAQGGPPDQKAGESGDGRQGGDFVWTVAITVPQPADGPHVKWKASQLPENLGFAEAMRTFAHPGDGLNFVFDAPMDTTLPPSGPVTTSIVTLSAGGESVPVAVKWLNNVTLNVQAQEQQIDQALRKMIDGGQIVIGLAGGPKVPANPTSPAMQDTNGNR
ncbi:MAG: hypothetical protein JO165_06445, partial [Candidatus Eremiobacteraeota bacterium]|nr:hypothetical protein [Candidatus Eremiobacteraeota bacterium]